MPQTPEVAPSPYVAKEPVDIKLGKGIDERTRPELIDWTQFLRVCENMTLDDGSALTKKKGLTRHSTADDTSVAYNPVYRLVSGEQNAMVVGKDFQLYDVNESADVLVNKGKISELSVHPYTVTARSGNIPVSIGEDTTGHVYGYAICTKYVAISVNGRTVLVDRKSLQCVREWNTGGHTMAFVDDRYLHVQVSGSVSIVDTNGTLPSTLSASVSLTSPPTNVVGVVAASGHSLIVYTDGVNIYADKVSNAGSLVASWSTTETADGLAHGACTDGTYLYVSGINTAVEYEVNQVTISSMALNGTMNDSTTTVGDFKKILCCCNTANPARLWFTIYGEEPIPDTASDTIVSMKVFTSQFFNAPTALTSLGRTYGWLPVAHPFYSSVTDRAYVQTTKAQYSTDTSSISGATVGDCYIICISDIDTYIRPAARLDNYTAVATTSDPFTGSRSGALPMTQFADSNYVGVAAVSEYASQYARGYEVVELRCFDPTRCHAARNLFSGGCMMSYQGSRISEVGIADTPSCFVYDTLAGTGPDAGAHSYVAVYVSSAGNGEWRASKVSLASSIVATGAEVRVSVPEIKVTKPTTVSLACYIYRTVVAGTQYYYVGEATASGGWMTLTDDVSDGDLITKPKLFRQPGTPGTALDRLPPLASAHVILHKDRIFYARGSTVYYSSFFVDGEHPWFNPQFSFPVFGGSGPIVGLASMNGQLVILKKDAIFAVEGDGPGEAGGSGAEFSPPRRVTCEFGCVDARSMVLTEKGLMYVSQRGVELLTESLSVVPVGDLIQNTFAANPYVGGATYDRTNSRVYFCLGAARGSDLRLTKASGGVVAVWDTIQGAWTINKYAVDTRGYAMQDVCFAPLTVSSDATDKVCFLNDTYLFYENTATCLDNSNFNNFSVVTGDCRLISGQDRARISDFLALMKKVSNHNLTISVAYNYSDSYSYSKTWTAADMASLTLEQLELQLPVQSVMAARFKIEDATPTDPGTYPVTTGQGPDILFLTVKMGAKGGGAKLAAGQKG